MTGIFEDRIRTGAVIDDGCLGSDPGFSVLDSELVLQIIYCRAGEFFSENPVSPRPTQLTGIRKIFRLDDQRLPHPSNCENHRATT